MDKRPLLYLAGGFVLGEVLGLRCMMAVWILMILSGGYLYYRVCDRRAYTQKWENQERKSEKNVRKSRSFAWRRLMLFFALLFFCGMVVGLFRGTLVRRAWEREQSLGLDGEQIRYTGEVKRLTDRGDRWEMQLEGLQVYVDKGNVDQENVDKTDAGSADDGVFGSAAVSGAYLRPRIGNRVVVEGKVQAFERARNPGQFDFRNYYRAQKLSYRMSADRCFLLPSGKFRWRSRISDGLWQLGDQAGRILDRVAEPEDAGIFKAAILGDKTDLDADVKNLYQRNGIAHLLAISALHLSLISMAVYSGLRRVGLGFGGAGAIGGIFLIGFAAMTGMSPSIVRALVMALCGYLAAYLGRTYDLLSALSLAACLILWDSPYQVTQAGVQLSFAAVLGIAAVAPILQRQGLSAAMAVSIGMQLTSLPILLYHYFQIPLYSIFLNLIVVPLMGIVIASGAAGIMFGNFSIAAGKFAVGSGHFILRLYEILCTLWMRLPGSNVILGQPKSWQIGVYYSMFVLWMVRMYFGKNEEDEEDEDHPIMMVKRALPAIMLVLVLLPHPPRDLQITMLDVGQGDGICLRTRAGIVLVDGGSTSEKTLGEDILEPYLKSQAVRIIDYAIVSHGDKDHVNGLQYLLEEGQDIRIRHLVLPAAGRGDAVYDGLTELALAQGADVIWLGSGDRLMVGQLQLDCIYPDHTLPSVDGAWSPISEERNEHSLVICASCGNFRLLLTGDMSAAGEQEILNRWESVGSEIITVLKVAHHGSRYSTTADFLAAIRPGSAIISCAEHNSYGHPAKETLTRLKEANVPCRITMDCGAITITTDGKNHRTETFLTP